MVPRAEILLWIEDKVSCSICRIFLGIWKSSYLELTGHYFPRKERNQNSPDAVQRNHLVNQGLWMARSMGVVCEASSATTANAWPSGQRVDV